MEQLVIGVLVIGVLGLLVIAAATALAPRFNIAAPLLLVVLGIAISFLPFVPAIEIEPELVLAGILPPLLYSASVSLPAMDFRREFGAIGGLSVVLVILSSVILGVVFAALIPGLGLAWGIALGAIVSPTDAVATSIVKRLGVSGRIVALLEGESLLNDATALVLLRSAIAGAAASVSLPAVAGSFVFAVVVAVLIGYAVGRLNLWVRARVPDATVNTVISFTVPFLASIPAELLGASGLVAAVAAGLVTGRGAPRVLSPQHRLSDVQVWRAIELILEGAVFLLMGLELYGFVEAAEKDDLGFLRALGIAALALLLTVVVRTAYVAPLLVGLHRRAKRGALVKDRVQSLHDRLSDPETRGTALEQFGGRRPRRVTRHDAERLSTRVRRMLGDIDYFLAAPLGWREGTVVVWAGMRGAITVAAAQTLPADTPNRSLLVLIAFMVAAASLLLQGGTLAAVVGWVKPALPDLSSDDERARLMALLDEAAARAQEDRPGGDASARVGKQAAVMVIAAQRRALLNARDDGAFSADLLQSALANLDADQITLELKGGPGDALDGTPPPRS
ncbi:cation:proton antiporter [Naasia aerilata]|uniref:Peptidase n=1 Tax=Naasia aerilata TaxID=1162966 RepID=A0ABN6XPP1_9MICO|nr:cation:proton antiporter [Naasia aerilata]BDZ46839.1 peptidase [Naasia aerilata]